MSTNANRLAGMEEEGAGMSEDTTEDIISELLSEILQEARRRQAENARLKELVERLKLEAQVHAQEARTANATIAEIYQVVSVATGEQGNWHGAQPVKEMVGKLKAQLAESEKAAYDVQGTIDQLKAELAQCEKDKVDYKSRKDAAYLERNKVVAALAQCFPSGITQTAIEGWHSEWHGCVYIDLPTGQVSWHYHDSHAYLFADLPNYSKPWDGHDTDEKYRRVGALDKEHTHATQREARQRLIVEGLVSMTDDELSTLFEGPDDPSGGITEYKALFEAGYRTGLEKATQREARLREALTFISSQNKPGNWAVEIAKRALEEAPDKSDLLFDPYYGMIKLKIVDEKEGT